MSPTATGNLAGSVIMFVIGAVLRFAVDLRYAEIGAVLDCSEDAARRRVHDGLSKLRAATVPAGEEAAA